jgi:two-component system sensor histidine kinase/response regulator
MKKFNVLVINSYDEEVGIIEQMLGANDFRFDFVQNGKSVLTKIESEGVDLIFIDAGHDQKEAFATCLSIKYDSGHKDIPVIFMIDCKDSHIIEDSLDNGGDDYVLKPFSQKELLKKSMFHIELKFSRKMSKDITHILEEKVAERTVELEESLQKLNKAKKELESLDIAKSEFLNLISHEIRTPLNGIMGSLALIGRYHFTDEVNTYFSLLDISVKRLELFSNTILEASNLRLKGEKALVFNDIDPINAVNEAINQCSGKYAAKGIIMDLESLPNKPFIRADLKFLTKCLLAIIDNAYKFSPERGTIHIEMEDDSNGFLMIAIKDQGPGFSIDAMENIFEPLSNIKNHYDKNTGMGLHFAKLIVEAHSGLISVKNIEPNGAEIEIKLPVSHREQTILHRQNKLPV